MASGCATDNRPPTLDFVADQSVLIGEGLRLELSATDPDGDTLTFEVTGLPASAEVIAASQATGLLYWNPLASDTEPGGKIYDVTVTVADGRGGTASQALSIAVFSDQGAPRFALPGGVVMNLATDDDLALIVEIKDPDSVDVSIVLVEAPEGAKLQAAGPKSAYFHWKPSEEQRDIVVHRAVFAAQDETHSAVEHELTLVLLNAEDAAGCGGTPPTVTHTPPGDTVLAAAAPLVLQADIVDGESAIATASVVWRIGSLTDGDVTPIVLSPPAAGFTYDATLPLGTIPDAGQLVHYAFRATDNDDTTGNGCDRTTRLPKSGWYTVAVYPDTGPAGACVDDPAEPDSSVATAPNLAPGLYPGRRICGQDVDYARVAAPAGTSVTAQVLREPSHGEVILRLLDEQSGQAVVVDEASGEKATLTVAASGGGPYIVEVQGMGPKPQLSYMLVVTADEAPCSPDPLEPNDSAGEATPGTPGLLTDPVICPGDADWFGFDLAAGETLTVSAAFEHAYGDLDLELLGADGVKVLTASSGENSTETVEHTAVAAETVYARVFGHEGVGNSYSLLVERQAAGATECDDDLLAPNHDWAVAITLFQGVYQNLQACPAAPDWFSLDVNGGETLNVLVEVDAGEDVRVRIYDDPTDVALVTATADASGIAWAVTGVPTPGKVYYEITGTGAKPVGYTLLQDVADPPGVCQPDRFEPNDTSEEAAFVEPGVHTWIRLCGQSDQDYFRVAVPPFSTLEILTSHEPGSGYADVAIIDPSGATVADVLDTGSGLVASVLAESPGVYRVRVTPFDVGDVLAYDLAILLQ